MGGNLYDIVRTRFPDDMGACFIALPDARRLSYADLERQSARLAHRLTHQGARPGDRVMAQAEKSPEAVFLYLACLRAGLVYLPLNTGYRAAELDYFRADAEPSVIVCDPGSPLASGHGSDFLTLDAQGAGTLTEGLDALPDSFETALVGGADVAAMLYTSGTTGRPKGAMLTHDNLASNALALHQTWGFGPDDVLLHALPLFHSHGLFVALNVTLMNGTGMIFLPRFDADEVIRLLPRATVMMGVPTFYGRLLAAPAFDAGLCRHMRLFISGSAPLTAETFAAFEARSGHAILERYGMTETNMNTSNPLDGERVAGSVGFPLPGVEVRVCDDDGTALADGAIGDIEVRGPNVFKGYWRQPEKTAQEFRADGFFKTGDVGMIDARGYVHIVGRSKDLVISGGYNVYPKEVETVLDRIAGIAESAVVGVPHPDFGEGVVAVATTEPGASPDADAVIAEAKRELASYKLPKALFFVDAIPKNVMGKVEKAKLRERYRDLFMRGGD